MSMFCLLSLSCFFAMVCAQWTEITNVDNNVSDCCTNFLTRCTDQPVYEGVQIEMRSWTYTDRGTFSPRGYIKVGGETILASSWEVITTPTHLRRGIGVVVLDRNLTKISAGSFDLWGDSSAGYKLARFLKGIPNDAFFFGISADTVGHYLNPAKRELNDLGIHITDNLRKRDAVLFLGRKGSYGRREFKVANGEGPLTKSFYIERVIDYSFVEA